MTSDRSHLSNRTTVTTTSHDDVQQAGQNALSDSGENAAVRIRFAPSPTGFQHIGGFRTALFDWLFARHYDGQFLLRIEDTDTARTVPGAVDAIIEGFRWLGMEWHEGPIVGGPYGPYFQTQRLDLYHSAADTLMASNFAYPCFCTPERLQAVREAMRARGEPPRYDRHCRPLSAEERRRRIAAGESYVVRLAVPKQGVTRVHDALRGEILFENATLDDAVLLKSNGYPTYHLAHVVDDHLMGITHVIRAEEWIPSAPLHVIEYAALGWDLPRLVHVPDVLGHDGKKLSKRHGALPLLVYRDMGYLPEAILNYMALLGWSYDDKADILTADQIIAAFTLDRVGTSAARFDVERLLWMNGVYIRRLTPEALVEQTLPFLERREADGGLPDSVSRPLDRGYVRRVLLLEQERMKTLVDAVDATTFFFEDELDYPPELLIAKQMDEVRTLDGLREAQAVLVAQPEWEAPALEQAARELVARLELKPGQLFASLRVAVTGRTVSPPLFETMEVLGRQRSLERIALAISRLDA